MGALDAYVDHLCSRFKKMETVQTCRNVDVSQTSVTIRHSKNSEYFTP